MLTSGATYGRLPYRSLKTRVLTLPSSAIPHIARRLKSLILSVPAASSGRFPGLRSLCYTPCRRIYAYRTPISNVRRYVWRDTHKAAKHLIEVEMRATSSLMPTSGAGTIHVNAREHTPGRAHEPILSRGSPPTAISMRR